MLEVFIALAVGLATGFLFSFFKLPVPAPGHFAAVVGVFGIFAGAKLYDYVVKFFS